jgi:hypothetical protein
MPHDLKGLDEGPFKTRDKIDIEPLPSSAVSKPFDHLVDALDQEAGAVSNSTLGELNRLVEKMKTMQAECEQLEAALIEAKRKFNQLSMIDIPQLLLSNGLSEIKLATGEKLKVSQNVSCTIKNMDAFAEFLTLRGDDAIIKTGFTVGKLPAEMVNKIRAALYKDFGLEAEINQTVHSATLQKYIKEICAIGVDADQAAEKLGDRYVPLQDLPESVSVYTYFKTALAKK